MSANAKVKNWGFVNIAENPTANHPEVIRLAHLFAECGRLAVEVEHFLADHPPQCRCRCCVEIRAAEVGIPTPHLQHHLITVFTVLDSLGSLCWEQRPASAEELREMRDDSRDDGRQRSERKPRGKDGEQ